MNKVQLNSERAQLIMEKNTTLPVFRRMTKSGGITIPAYLRRSFEMEPKDTYEIKILEDGDILLHKVDGFCPITGETTNLININGVMISADVLFTLKELDNVTIQSLIQTREEIDYNILVKKLDLKNKLRELEAQKLEDEKKLLDAEKKMDVVRKKRPNKNKKTTTTKPEKLKARASKKEVAEILKMFEEGATVTKISKVMGITKERVQKAVDTGK